ncbi:hypothetical protein BT96DRAFT_923288 [Gymnopus androsaceus JB14]|uniref:Uncharacterized protein n=1 Tax=Gymnopus androsaceus JB14 TaxID=1447944 RepID=A0A6A4HBV8_9AGAR|nr:hypothetical protein BT96DRAFT_923288 [Gymnopus androsaceus JB14]
MAPTYKQWILLPANDREPQLKSIEYPGTTYMNLETKKAIVLGPDREGQGWVVEHHIITPRMAGIEVPDSLAGYIMFWERLPSPNEALIRLTEGKSDRNLRGSILIGKILKEDHNGLADCDLDGDLEIVKQYLKWFPGGN